MEKKKKFSKGKFRCISKHRGSKKHQRSFIKLPRKKKKIFALRGNRASEISKEGIFFFSWGAGLMTEDAHTPALLLARSS